MPTYVFYADAADGSIASSSATYATAVAGTGTLVGDSTSATLDVGQRLSGGIYECREGFLFFDTSVIPDASVIFEATLALSVETDASATNFRVDAYAQNWGTTLETTDFVAGADISSKPYLATLDLSLTTPATTGYTTFSSNADFTANISKTGNTSILLASSNHSGAIAPTGDEYIRFRSADAAGTTNDPKLTVSASADLSATLGTNSTKTSGTSLVITTTAAVAAGETIAVAFAMDPAAGAVSATDSAGNTYVVQSEVTNGSGTSGARVVLLAKHDAVALPLGGTITITHPSCAARAASAASFALDGPGAKVTAATNTGTSSAAGGTVVTVAAAVMTPLIIAAVAREGPSSDNYGESVGFSALPAAGTDAGGAATNMTLNWAWRGAVDETDHTFKPTWTTSRTWAASILILDSTTAQIRTFREKVGMRESDDPADDVVDVGLIYNPATGFASDLVCNNNKDGLMVKYQAVVAGTTYGGNMGYGDSTAALPANTVSVTVDSAGNFDYTGMDDLDFRIPG